MCFSLLVFVCVCVIFDVICVGIVGVEPGHFVVVAWGGLLQFQLRSHVGLCVGSWLVQMVLGLFWVRHMLLLLVVGVMLLVFAVSVLGNSYHGR